MKRVFTLAAITLMATSSFADCTAKTIQGTWRYYTGSNYAPNGGTTNISRCEAALTADKGSKTTGTFVGSCWISPGKPSRTVSMFGTYEVENTKTCDVLMLKDMGPMGVSRHHVVVAKGARTWTGQWTNKGGNWGLNNGVYLSKSTDTPPDQVPYPIDDYAANP